MATPTSPGSENSTCSEQNDCTEAPLMDALFKSLRKVQPVIRSNAAVVEAINSIQDQVIQKGTIDPESLKLLRHCYTTSGLEIAKEIQLIENALKSVHAIKNLRIQKLKSQVMKKTIESEQFTLGYSKLLKMTIKSLPLWVPKRNEPPPQLCGAIAASPLYIAKRGDLVAAWVTQPHQIAWILAEVIAFKNRKYEVEDIDVTETNRYFTLKKEYVKPLPLMRASPLLSPTAFFPKNTFVFAMYPKSTCFFKGLVQAPPKTTADKYQILFENEDDKYQLMMPVDQQFVIAY